MTDPLFPVHAHNLYDGPSRRISGDPLRDGPDLDNPEHLERALEQLNEAKVELPPELRDELKRMQLERTRKDRLRAAHEFVLAELERIHAAQQAARDAAALEPPPPPPPPAVPVVFGFTIKSTKLLEWLSCGRPVLTLHKGENGFPTRSSVPEHLWSRLDSLRKSKIIEFEGEANANALDTKIGPDVPAKQRRAG